MHRWCELDNYNFKCLITKTSYCRLIDHAIKYKCKWTGVVFHSEILIIALHCIIVSIVSLKESLFFSFSSFTVTLKLKNDVKRIECGHNFIYYILWSWRRWRFHAITNLLSICICFPRYILNSLRVFYMYLYTYADFLHMKNF